MDSGTYAHACFPGTTKGENGINPESEPMTLETVDRFAREIGFKGRYQLNLPKGETGVDAVAGFDELVDMVSLDR